MISRRSAQREPGTPGCHPPPPLVTLCSTKGSHRPDRWLSWIWFSLWWYFIQLQILFVKSLIFGSQKVPGREKLWTVRWLVNFYLFLNGFWRNIRCFLFSAKADRRHLQSLVISKTASRCQSFPGQGRNDCNHHYHHNYRRHHHHCEFTKSSLFRPLSHSKTVIYKSLWQFTFLSL